MKTNEKSTNEQLRQALNLVLAKCYSDAISDNVKRAFKYKKEQLAANKKIDL